MEYDPDVSLLIEYDPVSNWDMNHSNARWGSSPTRVADAFALLDVGKLLSEASKVAEISRDIDSFLKGDADDVFNLSAFHVLKKLGIPTSVANKKYAHSAIRAYQLRALNASPADVLKVFQLSKPVCIQAIQRAISTYEKDLYNLSVKWTLRLSGKRYKVKDMLLAMYLLDEALALKD